MTDVVRCLRVTASSILCRSLSDEVHTQSATTSPYINAEMSNNGEYCPLFYGSLIWWSIVGVIHRFVVKEIYSQLATCYLYESLATLVRAFAGRF